MKKKILGIFVCMLLIATALPVAGTINGNKPELKKENYTGNKESLITTDIDWWHMFRHDSGNTGCSSSKAPNTNELTWQKNIGEEIYTGVPVVVENKLYISTNWYYTFEPPEPPPLEASNVQKPFPREKPRSLSKIFEAMNAQEEEYFGGVYCLDADTGTPLWDYPMSAPNDPAVINGKVYVTDSDYYGYSSSLYCLDAETGAYNWQEPIDGWVTSSTIVADEKIYLGCIDFYSYSGTLHCFDLNGSSLWTYPMPTYEFMLYTAPAVCEGRVYFYTIDIYSYYNGNLYCLDAETGQYLWSKPISSLWYWWFGSSSPVCADGKVFAVDFDLYSYFGQLKCFNAVTGSSLWSYPIGLSSSTPAFCDNSVYITDMDLYSYNSWIYRINATSGTLIWKAPLPGYSYFFTSASPVLADNMIYIVPSDFYYYSSNDIYCLDADDGGIIWSYSLDYPTFSSPSIANGQVYIPDLMGNIYAFGEANEPPSTPSIDGEISGKAGKPYEYTFKADDPDGEDVYYFIYWGDGIMEPWNGPHPSGGEVTISHTWEEKGTYNISAKAKDIYGAESDWGILEVTMPKNQISSVLTITLFLERLIQRFPLLARIFNLICSNGNAFSV